MFYHREPERKFRLFFFVSLSDLFKVRDNFERMSVRREYGVENMFNNA